MSTLNAPCDIRARTGLAALALIGVLIVAQPWLATLAHAGESPGAAASSSNPPHPVSPSVVAERIKAMNPGTRVDSVSHSQIAGLYEVVMGRNVAYVDATGRYALFGHVWDMRERRDLTADRKAALDKVDVGTLPLDLALRHVRGKGTRTLYSFADPQCGYCRQLEQTLQQLDDVTVYTFVIPLLGPESRRLAGSVLCASQPASAWSALMLKGQFPVAANCDAKVDALAALAERLGVNGTPTLIAGDGRKTAGAMPAAQLSSWLDMPAPPASALAGTRTAATRLDVGTSPSPKTAPR